MAKKLTWIEGAEVAWIGVRNMQPRRQGTRNMAMTGCFNSGAGKEYPLYP